MARILICDDELSLRKMLGIFLRGIGHEVDAVGDAALAMARIDEIDFDLLITDLRLGRDSGLDVLAHTKQVRPLTEVILITAFADSATAVEAMKRGATDYVTKTDKLVDELEVVIARALEKRALVLSERKLSEQNNSLAQENETLKRKLGERVRLGALLGKSAAMGELFALIEKVGASRTTVLVTGESGVGKELVARAIHERSPRSDNPFVAINCGAIPEGLLESELFGHEKGAFTGASLAKPGLFETADGGTLFLDEIGELPLHLQVKLLRALQQRSIRPVGGTRDIEIDVRIVAATNRDLAKEVRENRFREDLYYRLNVIGLKVPPLRERKEDVLLLAEHFLARFAGEQGREAVTLSAEAKRALLDYDFPGNVRELENLMERAVTLSDGALIDPEVFPSQVRGATPTPVPLAPPDPAAAGELPRGFDLQSWLDDCERRMLERALAQTGGNKTEAAKVLGITFRSIRYRLAKLQMEAEPPERGEDEALR